MEEIVLRCGCAITENGEFVVGQGCAHCKECNAVSQLHPFGSNRISKLETR